MSKTKAYPQGFLCSQKTSSHQLNEMLEMGLPKKLSGKRFSKNELLICRKK